MRKEGETFVKIMDKARGTEFRSMVSSWKRDPRFMDVLDTEGDGAWEIHSHSKASL